VSDRIPTSAFSDDHKVLIQQIRWLLNEMNYTRGLIREGNYDEALIILDKEVDKNFWLTFNKCEGII
jgi:hypothetical protein